MKTILSCLLAVTFVLATSPSIAENRADLAKLVKYKQCPKCDLRRAYLKSKDLRGVNLYRANLLRANFNNADLRGAGLSFTNLTKAKLNKADLRGAKLTYPNLAGTLFRSAKFCKTMFRAKPRSNFITRNDDCQVHCQVQI